MARKKTPSRTEAEPDPAAADQQPGLDAELLEKLYELLYRVDLGSPNLVNGLNTLEAKYGEAVYSDLIYLLSHLAFPANEARRHWRQILTHRDSMQDRLGRTVDLRVALVSYFVEVNRKLKNPKIIELKLFEQTQASVYRDELTGLYNFRYFRDCLNREIQRGERSNQPMSLIMIDIDNFKHYNDRSGHEEGNRALATIARLLVAALRRIDVPARYGGEEFALILPSTTKGGALQVAERTRQQIEQHQFPHEETQPGGRLTVSLGIATWPADAREADQLVQHADSALYIAKARGRNQVHLYGQNRRSFRRIDAALNGRLCQLAAEYHPLTTVNLSEGGFLFLVDRQLPIGSLLDISITLPSAGAPMNASARVIRVEEQGPGRFETAIRIIDIAAADRARLAEYIQASEEDEPADGAAPPVAAGQAEH